MKYQYHHELSNRDLEKIFKGLIKENYPQKYQINAQFDELYWSQMEFFYDFKRMQDFKLSYDSLDFTTYMNLLERDLKS